MKIPIKASIIALGALILSHAALGGNIWFMFTNDPIYPGGNGNLFTDEEGNPLSGYDNYVVGIWYQTYGTDDQWTLAGGGYFEDQAYADPSLAGMTESTPQWGVGTPSPLGGAWIPVGYDHTESITFMIRAWDYGSPVITPTGGEAISLVTDNQQLIDSFNSLITGSKYAEVVFTVSGFEAERGKNIGAYFPGAVLDQIVGDAVPEPSTYAALAGLAILGFAALRRRRR
ncbi:PEP-CTERM putative exosortase interaction domain-containing protein [Opitutaceae bacterium TAV1]|nr:PEP-CTERM putative exosortase interaction domain-containing protein [Opitutaceae bacterium TAV1]